MPGTGKKKGRPGRKPAGKRAPQGAPPLRTALRRLGGLKAADVMARDVLMVHPETAVEEVSSLFQFHNIHGAPVVDHDGILVGIVTENDLVFGQMGTTPDRPPAGEPKGRRGLRAVETTPRVADIMTPNPIAAEEGTPVEDLCNLMWRLKIHRIPIVREGKVTGIVSSLDICRVIADGQARLSPAKK